MVEVRTKLNIVRTVFLPGVYKNSQVVERDPFLDDGTFLLTVSVAVALTRIAPARGLAHSNPLAIIIMAAWEAVKQYLCAVKYRHNSDRVFPDNTAAAGIFGGKAQVAICSTLTVNVDLAKCAAIRRSITSLIQRAKLDDDGTCVQAGTSCTRRGVRSDRGAVRDDLAGAAINVNGAHKDAITQRGAVALTDVVI